MTRCFDLPDSAAADGFASVWQNRSGGQGGFTLVELLAVMSIIVVLLSFIVPALTKVNSGRQATLAAFTIEGVLDTARAYAKANNTYTWVGFFEEDGSKSTMNPPSYGSSGGRVVVSTVASRDGTAIYPVAGEGTALKGERLIQVNKLVKLDNIHLDTLAPADMPNRGTPPSVDYQVGNDQFNRHVPSAGGTAVDNLVTFTYPASATGTGIYTMKKIIQFNPLGDATKIVDSPTQTMEIGLRPAHNGVPDTQSKNCFVIQIAGIGGAVRIYQP